MASVWSGAVASLENTAYLRAMLWRFWLMNNHADDLAAAVRHALETTRATAACPFHWDVIIRVGDDAAESHAFERAKKSIRSDGTTWAPEALREEFSRQLGEAADGKCPRCES